jgi:hypothetical protein
VRSSAVKVEEGEHACLESLNRVGTNDCRLQFRGRGERGAQLGGVRGGGGASASVLRGLILGEDGLDRRYLSIGGWNLDQ